MLINKDNSILMIIDVQEKIAPVMENAREVIDGAKKLLEVSELLGVERIITEQYPKGLGESIFDVKNACKNFESLEKTSFSCLKDKDIAKAIKAKGKKQIILSGIEAHICILQTAMELKQKGFEVFVVVDACGSRDLSQASIAFQRLLQNGVELVSVEMVLFEWLEDSTNPFFKEISKKYL